VKVAPRRPGSSSSASPSFRTRSSSSAVTMESSRSSKAVANWRGSHSRDVLGLTPRCLGRYCAESGRRVFAFVDGRRLTADPAGIVLTAHDEVVIAYGTRAQLPQTLPSHSTFPPGLCGGRYRTISSASSGEQPSSTSPATSCQSTSGAKVCAISHDRPSR
jgi:hypothetical protein